LQKEVKRQLYLLAAVRQRQDTEEGKVALEKANEELREVERELEELQGRGGRHSKERERFSKEMLVEEKKASKKEAEIDKKVWLPSQAILSPMLSFWRERDL